MNKIIFINRFFYPDHSATSQMLSDLAFGLVSDCHEKEVHIVTSQQRYDDPSAKLIAYEVVKQVHIHRIKTTQFGRKNLIGRTIDYISFYLSAAIKLFQLTKKNDILVAKTDPPLISVVVALIAWIKKAELINWLQDLFPEVAAALGVKFVSGVPYNILKSMRNKTLNQAKINIVIGELMAERLQKEGIAKEKIVVIPNWADGEKIKPIPHEENPLRKQWGLEGKYVVGYSGNLGRSHDFSTILAAAELLRNESEIVFLIIGDGAQLVKIKQECKEKKLDNVKFKPYQPRDDLQCSLSVSDIHLISLKPELEGMIVPSKFYGILAAGRPVIFIGDRNGELSCMIRDYQCGFVVSADNYHQLYDVVVMQCKVTKSKGNNQRIRKVYEDLYEKIISIDRFRRILS